MSAQCSAGRTMSRMTYGASLVSLGRQAGRRSACLPPEQEETDAGTYPTLSSWVQGIVLALELEGLDGRQLFAELGLDYQALRDPDARFPQDAMSRLWQRAVALSGNPAIA